ncbi:hypothetical protein DFH11DRAFT_1507661, partial [Phellopilus nigrolimitatus]
YFRITISKITTCFFLFSFLHCFIHGIVQSVLFSFDAGADLRVSTILKEAEIPPNEIAWLTRHRDNFTLQLCKDVPIAGGNKSTCELIFQTGAGPIQVPQGYRKRGSCGSCAKYIGENWDRFLVDICKRGSPVFLNEQCTRVLVYANQVLANSKREELALVGSEFWLLGLSVFAIMYDSIPHLIAGYLLRVLSTAWSAYAIWRTLDIRSRFQGLLTDGACGVDLFPDYFDHRIPVQIADLSLNTVALLLSCYLVWNLVRTYATCMFKRVGAPEHLIKVYRFFCGIFICLQMSVYLLVTSTSLWIDQLVHALVDISWHTHLYLGSFIVANIMLIPWIAMGWFSVRREMHRTMLAFLVVGALYVCGWGVIYYSQVFRWTWLQWPFFASLSVAAQIVQLASVVLGVVCRRSFHRGLAQYLYTDSMLERADFEPEVFPHKTNGDAEKQTFEVDFKVVLVADDDDDRR